MMLIVADEFGTLHDCYRGLLSAISGPDGNSAEMSPRKIAHIVKRTEAQDVGPGIPLESI
jgi:hypothetical protein